MSDAGVIAVDFGTAFSGYAFIITHKGKENDPYLRMWKPVSSGFSLDTPKTPTCILFDEEGGFIKFGYEAQTAYMKMRGEEAKKHYFFENFKMELYGKEEINRDMKIKAANKKEMEALKVFSESLRFLKDDALKTISFNSQKLKIGSNLSVSDFTWVLTVPAIWEDSAKQFMREAATRAGIMTEETKNNLIIALEPEAASVFCMKLPVNGFISQNHDGKTLDHSAGTKYIVVDCGGGTIDMTAQEVLKDGDLKELHKASGNNLGGQTVDRKFKEFLREIFCDGFWDEFEENFPSEVQKMMNSFTFFKQEDEEFRLVCSFDLIELVEEKGRDIERFFDSVQGASWDDEFITVSRDKLRSFFDDSLKGISQTLKEILEKKDKNYYLLLVGGFAQSQIVRQHVIDQFGDQCKVMCPSKPQEAIVRGALQFGRNPDLVASRKSVFTYGVSDFEPFDELKHKPEKKLTADGKDWCRDIFSKLVEQGEDVQYDETREHMLRSIRSDETEMNVRLFKTKRKEPTYVDEWGVKEVGSFNVKLGEHEKNKERKVKLEVKFGSTEITATGTDETSGQKNSVQIDFLTK